MALTAVRFLRWLLLGLVIALVVSQFIPVDRSNPPADPGKDIAARIPPPPPVAAALERACRDCHSNRTRWPWYSRVAPVSWVVVSDVKDGRRHLNFSEWGAYDESRAHTKLQEICDEVTSGGMPDFKYTLIHRDAALSPQEVSAICGWTKASLAGLKRPGAGE
jgi:hypothetical protein